MHSLDRSSDPKILRILAQSKNWAIPNGAVLKASLMGMGLPLLVSVAMAQEPNEGTIRNTHSALEQARAINMANQAQSADSNGQGQAASTGIVSPGHTMSALEAARAAAAANARAQQAPSAPVAPQSAPRANSAVMPRAPEGQYYQGQAQAPAQSPAQGQSYGQGYGQSSQAPQPAQAMQAIAAPQRSYAPQGEAPAPSLRLGDPTVRSSHQAQAQAQANANSYGPAQSAAPAPAPVRAPLGTQPPVQAQTQASAPMHAPAHASMQARAQYQPQVQPQVQPQGQFQPQAQVQAQPQVQPQAPVQPQVRAAQASNPIPNLPGISSEPTSSAAAVAASLANKQVAQEQAKIPPSVRERQSTGILYNHKHNWFYNEQLQDENVINLNIKTGGITVPRPNANTDYSANKSYIGHGNAHFEAPQAKSAANGTKTDPKDDPLASPYYDPFTGEVNIPESVKAQQRLERLAAEKKKKLTEEEDRLAQYDIDRAKQLTGDPNYKPFGDFSAHDRMYRRMPLAKDVFYVASGKDIQWLHNQIAPIERDLGAEIGFVLLDQNGLVALKDNAPFPLYGLSKFHLSYAVGALMSVRAETSSHQVKFNAARLSRNIVSPFFESITGANRAAIEESVSGGYGARRSKAERNRLLASAVKKVQSGTTAQDRAEARANSVPINQDASAYTTETHGNNLTISLGELLFYNLALGDANASSVLLDYLGTVKTLEVFDKTKGLEHVQYKTSELDTAISPILIENNHAPLYESAKLFASYSQDKDISNEVRQAINDMLFNNQATRNTIQKGVREATAGESAEIINHMNIYSQGQVADYIEARRSRPVVSDMALIEYRGQRIVMVISCRNVKGHLNRTQTFAEDAIASVARVLFEYEKYRLNSRNFN